MALPVADSAPYYLYAVNSGSDGRAQVGQGCVVLGCSRTLQSMVVLQRLLSWQRDAARARSVRPQAGQFTPNTLIVADCNGEWVFGNKAPVAMPQMSHEDELHYSMVRPQVYDFEASVADEIYEQVAQQADRHGIKRHHLMGLECWRAHHAEEKTNRVEGDDYPLFSRLVAPACDMHREIKRARAHGEEESTDAAQQVVALFTELLAAARKGSQ